MILFAKLTQQSLGQSTRVVLAQVRGVGAEGDDDNAEPADSCEVIFPMGMVSRADIPANTSHVEAVCLRDGDELHVVGVLDKSLAALTSSDLVDGELLLFCPKFPTATKIKLDVNGKITASAGNASLAINKDGDVVANANGSTITLANNGAITVDGGSNNVNIKGGNIVMKSGSTPVAKEGSATSGHIHTVTVPSAGLFDGNGLPCTGTATAVVVTATDTIASGAGSPNVKVP